MADVLQIDLTDFELFKSFAEIEGHGLYIDLHNEFKCDSIIFQNQKRELVLSFSTEPAFKKKAKQVDIIFEDITIELFSMKDDNELPGAWTIDNIYRGRFEIDSGILSDVSNDGRYYYYIDFYQDYSFELFAKAVKANVFLDDRTNIINLIPKPK
ncbi:MAG TPA: hypothetical protein VFE54_08930 [Mucilaginibacter sp.]|jgi:hypothetical protein|nr:hypothetical protein [Mucilaginibacter sp.]